MFRLIAALIAAAILEAGGNALLRQGLLRAWWPLLVAGVTTLGLYGLLVNQSGLDFHDLPSARTLFGGTLIVLGGLTILIQV